MGNITCAVPSMKDLLAEESLDGSDNDSDHGDADEGGNITAAVPRLTDLLHEEEEVGSNRTRTREPLLGHSRQYPCTVDLHVAVVTAPTCCARRRGQGSTQTTLRNRPSRPD
eukprot:9081709-Pyramimonas_sp.AAC.1